MATAIPDEAIDKFRRLEARAEAARAKSESIRERIDRARDQERDLKTNLYDYYRMAAVAGRIEIDDEGTISYVTDKGTRVLAERQPTALRLKKIEAAIKKTQAEQVEHRDSAAPILALTAACREALVQRGWDGL